ncbi:MAG: colanic acid biosynthesis glycosyltransferase WcaL [Planctomycetes bacterium]|nr:colanic acid biosynthesis glycosyltransferase WcaL [Planctomycetota bacterium]
MSNSNGTSLLVVHSVPGSWLPPTQAWLYDQVRMLPAPIESHVVCDGVEHADRFPMDYVHTARAPRAASRLARLRGARYDDLLYRTVIDVGADVIHSHFGPEAWRNLPAAGALDVAHVVSFYGYDVNQLPRHRRWRRRYRTLFRTVDRVLCEGEHMAACLRQLGCPADTVQVQRLGVDLATLPYRPRSWDGREPLRVLLASAFREKKGLPLAIEALGRIAGDVELAVTLVGDATPAASSLAEKSRINEALDRTGLRRRTTHLGFQPWAALRELAYTHHLHVAPSRTASDGDTEGGAPVTLIAFAATGMPVVSTHHCDIPGVIRPDVSGYLAREDDVDDLERQIRRAIDAAPRWTPMLDAGRAWIEDRFDAAAQGARLAEIYQSLAAEPTSLTTPAHDAAEWREAA